MRNYNSLFFLLLFYQTKITGSYFYSVILAESSLGPVQAARYYADGGVGANSVLSAALTSPGRKSAADLGLAFYGALLSAPQDAAPTWIVSF